MTSEEAKAFFDGGQWKQMTTDERVSFQLFEERLCMPWDVFQEAVEAVFGRSVFTHEFADQQRLQSEFLSLQEATQ